MTRSAAAAFATRRDLDAGAKAAPPGGSPGLAFGMVTSFPTEPTLMYRQPSPPSPSALAQTAGGLAGEPHSARSASAAMGHDRMYGLLGRQSLSASMALPLKPALSPTNLTPFISTSAYDLAAGALPEQPFQQDALFSSDSASVPPAEACRVTLPSPGAGAMFDAGDALQPPPLIQSYASADLSQLWSSMENLALGSSFCGDAGNSMNAAGGNATPMALLGNGLCLASPPSSTAAMQPFLDAAAVSSGPLASPLVLTPPVLADCQTAATAVNHATHPPPLDLSILCASDSSLATLATLGESPMAPPPQFSDRFLYEGELEYMRPGALSAGSSGSGGSYSVLGTSSSSGGGASSATVAAHPRQTVNSRGAVRAPSATPSPVTPSFHPVSRPGSEASLVSPTLLSGAADAYFANTTCAAVPLGRPWTTAYGDSGSPNAPPMQRPQARAPSGGASVSATGTQSEGLDGHADNVGSALPPFAVMHGVERPALGPYIPALGITLQPSTMVCRYHLQGYCTRGDRCNYVHLPLAVIQACSGRELLDQLGAAGALGPPPSARRGPKNGSALSVRMPGPPMHYPSPPLAGPGGMFGGIPAAMGHNGGGFGAPAPSPGISVRHVGSDDAKTMRCPTTVPVIPMPNPPRTTTTALRPKYGRQVALEEVNRFIGIPLEDLTGQLGLVCRDQDGCRYLQKVLEEGNPRHVDAVFDEIFPSFIEMMTDPFGNYLCQKLVEFASDEQKTMIVAAVSPSLIEISLNMHGTRAVQRMIEFLTQPHHLRAAAAALGRDVVALIKDLNGNHVIQKCLQRLSPEYDQFIYDAVTEHLVEISTHRHGCCVLQRCVDHASAAQRQQLVDEITRHALNLVQDPFANYVVQYIIDLHNPAFSAAVLRQFLGHICVLSVQKFSSNVIEKCIRVADAATRALYIRELNDKDVLERLIRDSYGNYVVQTALDYADRDERQSLVESIRPLLPAIRNTPYGKRFASKLHRAMPMARGPGPSSGTRRVGQSSRAAIPGSSGAPWPNVEARLC